MMRDDVELGSMEKGEVSAAKLKIRPSLSVPCGKGRNLEAPLKAALDF